MRNILKMKRETPIASMLNSLNLMSIKQRLAYNVIKMMYKIENGLLPEYLRKFMCKNRNKNEYNLRRKSLYDVPNFTKSYTQDSIFYKGLQLFNDFKKYCKKEKESNIDSGIIKFVKEIFAL